MEHKTFSWFIFTIIILSLGDSTPPSVSLNQTGEPPIEIVELWEGPDKRNITIPYRKAYGVICRDIQTGGKIYFAVNPTNPITVHLTQFKDGTWWRIFLWEDINTFFSITYTCKQAGTWRVHFVNTHNEQEVQLQYEVDYWKGETLLPPYRFIIRSSGFQLFVGHFMFLIFLAGVWVLTGKKQQGHFHLDFHKGDQPHAYERIRAQFLSDFPTSTIIKEAPPTEFQYSTGKLEGSLTISSQGNGGKIKGTVQRPTRKISIYLYIALYLAGAFIAGFGMSGALLYILGTLIMIEVPLAFVYWQRARSTCKTMKNRLRKALQ